MKVIGLIGLKNSGKTFLGLSLTKELKKRGHSVGVIKHIYHGLDLGQNDSAVYANTAQKVMAVNNNQFYFHESGRSQKLKELICSFNTDVLLVEGFKSDTSFPKLLCFDGEQEEVVENPLILANIEKKPYKKGFIKELCDLILNKAFYLPQKNCGKCGFDNCLELAKAIIKDKAQDSQCRFQLSSVRLFINKQSLNLNPFVSSIIESTLKGLLSNLEGYQEGSIKVEIDP